MSNEDKNSEINDRLRQLIFDLKLNASSFAKRIGVSPGVINNIVGGRLSKPSYEIIEKIISSIGVDGNWLITGKGKPFIDQEERATYERFAVSENRTSYALDACQKEVELLNQRINDKDELIQSLKAQLAMSSGRHTGGSPPGGSIHDRQGGASQTG